MNYYDYTPTRPQHYVVTQSARNMKTLARQTLSGKWAAAIAMALLIEVIVSGPGVLFSFIGSSRLVSFLSDVYTIVITGPATAGLTVYYLGIFRMQDPGSKELFGPFSDKIMFFKAMLVYCIMIMRIILMSFLFIIPGLIAAYKYSMAFKVLADHPEMSPQEILSESARIMDGNKLKLFLLQLSFWFLSILVNIPKSISAWNAQAALGATASELMINMEVFNKFYDSYVSNPIIIISYVLGVLLNVYVQVSECCFYDLASGNLVVKQASYGE